MQQASASRFVDALNRSYNELHTRKEDAFWTAYMGLGADPEAARAELDRLEIEWKRFVSDPERLESVRAELASEMARTPGDETARVALAGWLRTFEAHAIAAEEARDLDEETVAAEGRLAGARGAMKLGYLDPDEGFVAASSVKLGMMLRTEPREDLRRAAWEGLASIEPHVLESGFLDIVRMRNRLGRMLGAEDYYDWKVRRVEGMTKDEIFALLDALERSTRESAQRGLDALRAKEGDEAITPWNVRYLTAGDITRERDPYFPFESAIDCWGRSFAALGIDYRGARMVLDLVDRKGKYENGFMHGPEIAWIDGETEHAARIHFTANAIPGMVGSGASALRTLFHEGGHAAHFANVRMPAPCFGQEFAPTSVAFAETQSMFLDSLIGDADWMTRYAKTKAGEPIPWELIEKGIRAAQPFAAWEVRNMLSVCFAERAIYEIPDDELDAERVLAEIRAVEKRMTLLDGGSPRPTLSVPHLLEGDSSAYYHSYVLAEMAVHQTRAFFLERDGHLVDNPRIGPDLCEAYWAPGNSRRFGAFVEALTGRPLSADDLAHEVNRTEAEALESARAALDKLDSIDAFTGDVELGARIRIAHGKDTVAELGSDFDAFAATFAEWIESLCRSARE